MPSTTQSLAAPEDISSINLANPKTYLLYDMPAYWRRLRRDYPLYWHPGFDRGPGFWVISRYSDVMALYRDNERLTSESGNVLVTLLGGGDSAAGKMLAVTDGRRHKDLRNLMLQAFSPRALSKVAEQVRANTRRLVTKAIVRGEVDFAAEVAAEIPLTTVGNLLGVPPSDHRYLLSLTTSSLSSNYADQPAEDAWLSRNEILSYFSELVADRRANPRDDVLTALTRGRINGKPVNNDDIVFNCYSLIIGGDETSRLSMIEALYVLGNETAEWQRLKSGAVTVESATEELLRWATPAMLFGRRATTDIEIAGGAVAKDEIVVLSNTSANRDETVFDRPEILDLGRTPNRHLTFGYGPHFCLGAFLARIEMKELLDALRSFATDWEVVGEPQRIHSNLLTGMYRLPIRFTPDRTGLATADEAKAVT